MKGSYWKFGLVIGLIVFWIGGCGGDSSDVKGVPEELTSEKGEKAGESKGVAIAKEILQTYDMAVADISEALKDKPAAAEAKVKFEAVIAKYAPVMTEINSRYLALKSEDIALFGEANGWLGENRGKHVFKKDAAHDAILYHYMNTDKNDDMVDLLKWGLHRLLETALKR